MATIKQPDSSSIVERMQRIRTRLYLEKASGILVTDKEAFLALCREQELSEDASWKLLIDLPIERDNWLAFGNTGVLDSRPDSSFP